MEEQSLPLLPKYAHLKKEYEAAVKCNRCGFCETACPTYAATGNESLSPRGRNQAFRQILEGTISDPKSAAEVFSTCLTCHACTNVCFSQVPVGHLMGEARAVSGAAPSAPARAVMRFILANRRIMSVIIGTASFFKRIGISTLLRKIGILRMMSSELNAADELIDRTPLVFGGGRANATGSGPSAAYFSGCGTHYVYSETTKAFVRTLAESSKTLSCPNHACCGLIAQSAGDVEGAKILARANLKRFAETGTERIVADDDSCCGFLKNYPQLLDGAPEAAAFAGKVRNLSEYLSECGLPKKTDGPPPQGKTIRVTYHDACQMGNGQLSFAPQRALLENLPGVEFVELEEANWCCGGAGTYCMKHPDLADDVLERKLENIEKSGAEIVVTQASSCLLHIGYGLRKKGLNVRVVHLADFLEEIKKARP